MGSEHPGAAAAGVSGLQVVTVGSPADLSAAARALAEEKGAEVAFGVGEAMSVLQRRVAARRAAEVIADAERAEELLALMEAERHSDDGDRPPAAALAPAPSAHGAGGVAAAAPATAPVAESVEDLRACAAAAVRSAEAHAAAAARLERAQTLADTPPRARAPAEILTHLAEAAVVAESAAREADAEVGPRPPYDSASHREVNAAKRHLAAADRRDRLVAQIGRGTSIAAVGVALMMYGSGSTSMTTAVILVAAVVAVSVTAWLVTLRQARRAEAAARGSLARAGVKTSTELDELEAAYDEWERQIGRVARADQVLAETLTAWEAAAPGTDPAQVAELVFELEAHEAAISELEDLRQAEARARDAAAAARHRWLTKVEELGLAAMTPDQVDQAAAALEDRHRSPRDELARLLHGRPLARLRTDAARARAELDADAIARASVGVVIVDVDPPAAASHQQRVLEDLARRSRHLDVVLVTANPDGSRWGLPWRPWRPETA